MGDRSEPDPLPERAHANAAQAFVDRARSRHAEAIVDLWVFGSTVRGDASGRSSDVDVLVVLDDAADRDRISEALRDIALDVTIEFGPAVECHILSESTFERHRRAAVPFIQNVMAEGRSYA